MNLGATTKCFGGMPTEAVAGLFEACGLTCAELCFCLSDLEGWRYNFCGRSLLPSSEEVYRAVRTFSEKGVSVCAVGVYSCFWNGGVNGLSDSLMQFCEYCDIARECGIGVVATHAGALSQYGHRFVSDTVKQLLYDGFADACIEAEKRGVTIALEAPMYDALDTCGGFNELRCHIDDYIGKSSMLKRLCCPSSDVFFADIPCDDIAMYHIKDIAKDGKYYERPCDGIFDFATFFVSLKETKKPVILEYVNSGNLLQTANELREKYGI